MVAAFLFPQGSVGFVLLLALSVLAWLAAVAVAARSYPESVGDRTLASLVVWLGIVVAPIHVLGWTRHLTPTSLALLSALTSAAAFAAAVHGDRRTRIRRALQCARELLLLPGKAVALAFRQRGIVFVAVLFAYGILLWTAWLCWLAPSGAWDGLVYHEPIAYYAIQQHGFEIVPVSSDPSAQQINSAPRLGHYLSLWFVIFADRRLVEFPSVLMAGFLLVAFQRIARRFTDAVSAMGYAITLLLVPGILLQLRTTLQDSSFAAAFVVGAHYATVPRPRPRDVWMAGLALGFMAGFKFTGLLLAPAYLLVVFARSAWIAHRERRTPWVMALVGATALVAMLALPTYVRNWMVFHNPVWPRRFDYPAIGVHLPGSYEPYQRKPLGVTIASLFDVPRPDHQYADTRDNGYGNGPPFVVLPLAIIAFAVLLSRIVVWLLRRRARPPPEDWSLLWFAGPAFAVLPLSPAFHWARYTVYAIATAWVLTVWLLAAPRWRNLSQAVIGALFVTGAITLWWSEPGWSVSFGEALDLASMSPVDRTATRFPGNFNMEPPLARLRAKEIRAGDVVVYSEGSFIATLWNEDVTSRVHYVASRNPKAFFQRVNTLHAKWIAVQPLDPIDRALRKLSDQWEPLGYVLAKHLHVYRRRAGASGKTSLDRVPDLQTLIAEGRAAPSAKIPPPASKIPPPPSKIPPPPSKIPPPPSKTPPPPSKTPPAVSKTPPPARSAGKPY